MYQLEIDVSELGICVSDERGWRSASVIMSEGESLSDLILEASVHWTDKDGGDVDETWLMTLNPADFRTLGKMFLDAFEAKYPQTKGVQNEPR